MESTYIKYLAEQIKDPKFAKKFVKAMNDNHELCELLNNKAKVITYKDTEILRLRELLKEVMDDAERLTKSLVIENKLPHEYWDERVKTLGEEIGFGYVMQQCSSMWREKLEQSDMAGGEFNVGDCVLTITRSLTLHNALMEKLKQEWIND